MNALIQSLVNVENDEPMTTSLLIAEKFGKKHKNVLRDIEKIIAEISEFEGLGRLNFEPSSYQNLQNKPQKMYYLNERAFAILTMGFTGKEALVWKLKFLQEFENLLAEVEMLQIALHARKQKALFQSEKYWFGKYPHWEPVRTLCLEGLTNVMIAQRLNISASRVSRAICNMIRVGLIEPMQRLNARYQVATAFKMMQLPLFAGWGA